MSKQRIVSNVLIMGSGQIVTWVVSTIYLALVSRYLGPDRQGELSFAISIVAVLGLIIGLGMDTLIVRTVARTPDRAARLVSTAILVRTALGIPALAGLYLYVRVTHLNAETSLVVFILAAGAIVGSYGTALVAAFQGREQMSLGVIGAIAQNLLGLGLGILIVRSHGGVAHFALAGVLIEVLLLALNLYWMRRFARLTRAISLADVREMVVGSLSFWANSIFLTIYIYIDSIILESLAGTRAVGIYAPATRLFSVALFLPAIVGQVTLPMLSRLGIDAGTDFVRASRKTLSLLIACAVPLTIGLATFAGPLILGIFGTAFRLSAPVLAVLSLCIPFTFLNIQVSQMLTARDRQQRWTVAMAASCVLNPLANVMLIPLAQHQWHNGALGAAQALLITEVFMTAYGVWALRDVVLATSLARVLLASVIAGAAQVSVLWLAASLQLWPMIGEVAGVLTYGLLAFTFGTLPREILPLLRATVARRVLAEPVGLPAGAVTSMNERPPVS